MKQMANLTEEELGSISKTLDISKDLLREMTEEELLLKFETALQKLKVEFASETEKIKLFRVERFKLRVENLKLRIANAFLRLECFVQQVRIGTELTIQDFERFLRIK
jgi:hypothetical protein